MYTETVRFHRVKLDERDYLEDFSQTRFTKKIFNTQTNHNNRDGEMARRLKSGQDALLSIIGDEDTVTGFLLAGIGDIDTKQNTNFLIVDKNTTHQNVEDAFKRFTARTDIAVVLINQHVSFALILSCDCETHSHNL